MESTKRPFLTTGEIVKFAVVHPNTVAMWRATGKIVPKDKIGSSFLYDRAEVEAFLSSRMKKKLHIRTRNKKKIVAADIYKGEADETSGQNTKS